MWPSKQTSSKCNQRSHISLKGFNFTYLLGQISIFVIFLGHKDKAFVAFPVTVAMVTLIWSHQNYFLCICITDIDCVKYVENIHILSCWKEIV